MPRLEHPDMCKALVAISEAIRKGYDVARQEMAAKHYDSRVSKTAFSQVLHHSINQGIYDIGDSEPGIVTDLPPNPRRSHYHVIVVVDGVLIKVSAVSGRRKVPRYAVHRGRYALCQTYFRINLEGSLEIVDVPNPYDSKSLYLQVLHGSREDNSQYYGFAVIRQLDLYNSYAPDVIDMDEHLSTVAPDVSSYEDVTENFEIAILPTRGANHIANR